MNLSTQTSETSRSASKPLELQVHIQVDPVWHKSFYFRTRRIATVSQQALIHRWPQSQGEEERYQESWRAYLRTFHCDSAVSTYLPKKVPFTIPAQVTQTVNGRRRSHSTTGESDRLCNALVHTDREACVHSEQEWGKKNQIFLNKTLLF